MKYIKEHIYDEITKSYIDLDERVFQDCVTKQLQTIRQKAQDLILEVAPDYKQRNAALGLLSTQEIDEIKTSIQTIRTISNSLEQEILNVNWDGQESSRPAACDNVQTIKWP